MWGGDDRVVVRGTEPSAIRLRVVGGAGTMPWWTRPRPAEPGSTTTGAATSPRVAGRSASIPSATTSGWGATRTAIRLGNGGAGRGRSPGSRSAAIWGCSSGPGCAERRTGSAGSRTRPRFACGRVGRLAPRPAGSISTPTYIRRTPATSGGCTRWPRGWKRSWSTVLGNYTPNEGSSDFFRVDQQRYELLPALVVPVGQFQVSVGPLVRYTSTGDNTGRFIATLKDTIIGGGGLRAGRGPPHARARRTRPGHAPASQPPHFRHRRGQSGGMARGEHLRVGAGRCGGDRLGEHAGRADARDPRRGAEGVGRVPVFRVGLRRRLQDCGGIPLEPLRRGRQPLWRGAGSADRRRRAAGAAGHLGRLRQLRPGPGLRGGRLAGRLAYGGGGGLRLGFLDRKNSASLGIATSTEGTLVQAGLVFGI